ncbi:MAG TPA: S9 family peptidase [Chloroflexota bacterium]|nr:S9 family peptidase [Chloroflexota bacterium]
MAEVKVAPYGTWESPITPELITAKSVRLGEIVVDGDDIYWLEGRPLEGGRQVVVHRAPDGRTADVTPAPFNARTRVHEYGGAAYTVADGVVFFSNFADQRVYRQDPGAAPRPLTPAVDLRYADYCYDPRRKRLLAVREDHRAADREAINSVVSLDAENGGEGEVLVSGNDFYSNPRLSADGSRLAWLTWNHPNMPWDGTELWTAEVGPNGKPTNNQKVAGGLEESIFQPEWGPDGALYFASDRNNWWNLYRWRPGQPVEPVYLAEAEIGAPAWAFGVRVYTFMPEGKLVLTYSEKGQRRLVSVDLKTDSRRNIPTPYTSIGSLDATPGHLVFIGASPTVAPEVVVLDEANDQTQILRRSDEVTLDQGYLSVPKEIEFPTENGQTAYGYFYPPKNAAYVAPAGEQPPLIVISHGGPTSSTGTALNLGIQYWTSRGFAVMDVNYGGSTGYGRAYRQRLNGNWGIVDVNDCSNAARYLAAQGLVDENRLAIRGGSAGGYTTLAALTFRDVFKAGASHYGVSDLEALATDTHKFESRYLDSMIGPYPARRDLYLERSPLYHTDQLSCPIIFFQGLEDKVVPPNQAELMIDAMRKKGLPVAGLFYEGEQHGFRKAENIKRTLEAELSFYGQIFGFAPPNVEKVAIENPGGTV